MAASALSGLEDSSGDEHIQPQALVRPEAVPGEDLSAPPTDGHQFLRRVIEETKQCKAVVVADVKRKPQRTTIIPSMPERAACNAALLPDKDWQLSAVADFASVRLGLSPLRDRLSPSSVQSMLDQLPPLEDDEAWLKMVLQQHPDLSSLQGPSTRLCLSFSQCQLYELLGLMADWVDGGELRPLAACRWLYCLLACLEPPFSSSVYSRLRQIARALIQHRATLTSVEAEELPHVNLLVCIISRYFNQLDLADPFP